jgi:hypothetical protein
MLMDTRRLFHVLTLCVFTELATILEGFEKVRSGNASIELAPLNHLPNGE